MLRPESTTNIYIYIYLKISQICTFYTSEIWCISISSCQIDKSTLLTRQQPGYPDRAVAWKAAGNKGMFGATDFCNSSSCRCQGLIVKCLQPAGST